MHVISSLKHGKRCPKKQTGLRISLSFQRAFSIDSLEIVQVIEYMFTNLTQMNLSAVAGGCRQQQRLGSYASSKSHLNRLEIEKKKKKRKKGAALKRSSAGGGGFFKVPCESALWNHLNSKCSPILNAIGRKCFRLLFLRVLQLDIGKG